MDDETLQQQILASIGHICVQWALLETLVANIIWAELVMDHETGAIVTGGLDIFPRVNMAIRLAHHKKVPRPAIHHLDNIRKALQSGLGDRRNQAIHGVHAEASDPGATALTMLRWPEPKRTQEVSIEDLYQTSQEIIALQNLASEALEIIWQWQLRPSPTK